MIRWHRRIKGEVYHASLWRSFGDSKRCYKRLFALKQPVTLEIYLSNEAGRRNHTLEGADLIPWASVGIYNEMLESGAARHYVKERALEIKTFCEAYRKPKDRCLLALGLESNFTRKAAQAVARAVKQAGWAYRETVYNPAFGSQNPNVAYYHEHHFLQHPDTTDRRSIVSLDGNHLDICRGQSNFNKISSAELRYWLNGNRVRYFGAWCPMWQGNGQRGSRAKRILTIQRSELSEFLELWRSVYGNGN